MKLSKSLVIVALAVGCLLAGSVLLRAQNNTNPPPTLSRNIGGAMNIDRMAAMLKLDDATKAKFKTILEDQQKKIADLRAAGLSMQDRRAKTQGVMDDTARQLKSILTADQFSQWQKLNQPPLRRVAPPVGNPPPPPKPPQN